MSTHQIHIFISHSWSYSEHYETLAEWVFTRRWSVGQASLDLRDFSVPKDDPIHHANTDRQLADAIYAQIARSHVVIIPTGMYSHHSRWIQKEIKGAQSYRKPILAVDPRGQLRKGSVVASAATKTVGWNAKSVIDGIWELYRN